MNRADPQKDNPLVAELQFANPDTESGATQVHDCWGTIGVNGNGTCRELEKFVHCRNCPVYSAAGLQLLNRPLPMDYRRERTLHYAEAKTITHPPKTSLVIFRLGPEWLALPTTAFQEVAERRFLHTLPHRRRSVVLGLVNIRGELLLCVSLARLLGLEQTTDHTTSGLVSGPVVPFHDRLLVTNWDGQRLVFTVDEVHGIHRFHRHEMKEPPTTISKSARTHTQGIFPWPPAQGGLRPGGRERWVGFLNPDSLFAALNRALAKSG